MDRLSGIFLIRGIELLLAMALCKSYGTATCLLDLWTKFAQAPELNQIGTVTALVMIGRTIIVILHDVGAWLSNLADRLRRPRTDDASAEDAPSTSEPESN